MLWKVSDAKRLAAITDDFYTRCFGPASAEMKTFHERYLLAEGRPQLSEDLVGRMYRSLKTAFDQARSSPEILARLTDYVVYTRYLELSLAVKLLGRVKPAARPRTSTGSSTASAVLPRSTAADFIAQLPEAAALPKCRDRTGTRAR